MVSTGGELILLDPDGDLILKVGSAPGKELEKGKTNNSDKNHPVATQKQEDPPKSTKMLRIRVSSKFMTMCSPVFKVMLEGSFREGQLALNAKNPPTLHLPENEPQSILRMCEALHYKEEAYKYVSLTDICGVATLSDKYDCARVCRPWFQHQLFLRLSTKTGFNGRNLAQVLNASYLLDDEKDFHEFSATAARHLPCQIRETLFCKSLSPELKGKLVPVLEVAHNAQMEDLNSTVQKTISDILENGSYENTKTEIFRPGDGSIRVFNHCRATAKKVGVFMSLLLSAGLWPTWSSDVPQCSFADARVQVEEIAKRVDEDESLCCRNKNHEALCEVKIAESMETSFIEKYHIRGTCLKCLKGGLVSLLSTSECTVAEHSKSASDGELWEVYREEGFHHHD